MQDLTELSTEEFLATIAEVARTVFDCSSYPQEVLPIEDWTVLVNAGVFLPVLPKSFGGRQNHYEMVRVLECIAEWNLPVALYVTITSVVVLRPLYDWGTSEMQQEVLSEFGAGHPITCGLALTEPERGTSLAGMTTYFERVDGGGYHIRGRKHWQAFSSTARWWIVCAKEKDGDTFGFFVIRRDEGFTTVETYDSLGMRAIDYGLNEIDAVIPQHRRLNVYDGDLSAVVEILMSPRALMPAMGSGFLRRIDREARAYAGRRPYGHGTLADLPFVQYRLDLITASRSICQALKHHLETRLTTLAPMRPGFPQVHAITTVATEFMVSAANHYRQLAGGEGYRHGSPTNIAAQAFLNASGFTIVYGANDLLSQQLAQHCRDSGDGKPMSGVLAEWTWTSRATQHLAMDLGFLDVSLAQEHLVLAGRAIAYLFAVQCVMVWEEESVEDVAALAAAAVASLRADIAKTAVEFTLLAELSTTSHAPASAASGVSTKRTTS